MQPFDIPRFTLTATPPDALNLEEEVKAAEEDRRRAEQKRIEQEEEKDYRDMEGRIFDDEDEDDDE